MAEYQELVQTLTWLLTNRVQQKIQYTHGLLGDGNGRVRVSTTPGNPEVDYVYVRPDRFSNRTFKVFNKRIEGQDGDPVIIGELPWEPDLIQVVDMDWAAYADVGWGDDVTTTNRHGISHQWRDGAPGIDTFNVYRRQFGDLKTYPAISGTLAVGVSPYSLDIFGSQYQWPGTQSFSLSGALPAGTGTARMVLVYWDPSSGTTGYLGVASGTLGSSADATILNRPVTPEGAIPSAFVRLKSGQGSVTEFDIWDAREPFRPGILFSTGSAAGLNAGLIPIADDAGLYTGSTVEAALEQIGFDGARVSKIYRSDFASAVVEASTTEVVVNDNQADINFRIEGDTQENLMVADAGVDAVIFGADATERSGTELVTVYNTTTDNATSVIGLYANTNPNVASLSGGVTYRGLQFQSRLDGSGGSAGDVIGMIGEAQYNQTGGTLANINSGAFNVRILNTGTATLAYGLRAIPILSSAGGIGTFYAFQARSPSISGTGGITTAYGLYVEQLKVTGVTNSYGVRQVSSVDRNQFAGFTGFGTPSPTCPVHIDQASTTAAIPGLIIDQADLSEEFINFITTVGAGNPVDTAAIGTYYGKARVAVNGTFKYVALYNS